MSWEEAEAWPGTDRGGAFRGAAEPIVAQRQGTTWLERLRLFWHSTPEHPLSRVVERAAVTPRYVYVQRRRGQMLRAPLDRLHGERLEAGRVIYGVRGGDDLLLPYRDRCAVQVHLDAAVRGGEPLEPWRASRFVGLSLLAAIFFVAVTFAVSRAFDHPHADPLTVLWLALATTPISALYFFWAPTRWRIDGVAVSCARGVLPFFSFSIPPERVRHVVVAVRWGTDGRSQPRRMGWELRIELVTPERLGSLRRKREFQLHYVPLPRTGRSTAGAEIEAHAERLRALLALQAPVVVRRDR